MWLFLPRTRFTTLKQPENQTKIWNKSIRTMNSRQFTVPWEKGNRWRAHSECLQLPAWGEGEASQRRRVFLSRRDKQGPRRQGRCVDPFADTAVGRLALHREKRRDTRTLILWKSAEGFSVKSLLNSGQFLCR